MATPRRSLSKNLTQMKFMRRSIDAAPKKESETALTERWIAPLDLPDAPLEGGDGFRILSSFMDCQQLNSLGRFSFNGFNKDVERMTGHGSEIVISDDEEEEETISVDEVAKRYKELLTGSSILGKKRKSGSHGYRRSAKQRRYSEPSNKLHSQDF